MKVIIELNINLPVPVTDAAFKEWLEFELGLIYMRDKTPLDDYCIRAIGDLTTKHDIKVLH